MPPRVYMVVYTRVCLPGCITVYINPGMPPWVCLKVYIPGYASLGVSKVVYTRVCLPRCV